VLAGSGLPSGVSARTISVSIIIISMEFHGGGSGSGAADLCSILAHPARTKARTGRHKRDKDFITPPARRADRLPQACPVTLA